MEDPLYLKATVSGQKLFDQMSTSVVHWERQEFTQNVASEESYFSKINHFLKKTEKERDRKCKQVNNSKYIHQTRSRPFF